MIQFLSNKYTRCYERLVTRAKSRSIKDSYYENHHIIPKSLGGINDDSNIVKLTAREHFIAHLLLPKMVEGKAKSKMSFALHAVATMLSSGVKINSIIFESIRIKHALNLSQSMKGNFWNKGRKFSNEHKAKIGIASKKRICSIESRKKMSESAKGKIISESTKEKMSMAHKGRKAWNAGKRMPISFRQIISKRTSGDMNPMYGQTHSKETKLKMSVSRIGKAPSNKGVPMSEEQKKLLSLVLKGKKAWNKGIPSETKTCLYCGKTLSIMAIGRYHNEKCKFKSKT